MIFAAVCVTIYAAAASLKIYRLYHLKHKIASFEKRILTLEEKKLALMEDMRAVHDPIWLELALMEELGVIPEGAIKINYLGEL